ncbi:MAG: methionyl-tRNA formyltransferase [Oscillospiraceae bacterium]
MRILFAGTPEIAATMLRSLAFEHEICGAFCQPDKPVGRKAVVTAPAVKLAALELGIPVFQPTTLRDGAAAQIIRNLAPELIAVVAYGKLLPKEVLEIPPRGCVNIHASLLPKYRGAAPIQRALMNGERSIGVCSMYMDEGLDTGDIIESVMLEVSDCDDAVTMFARVGVCGAQLLSRTANAIERGDISRTPQRGELASFAPPLKKEEGAFCWTDDARDIFNKVRALSLWPNAFFVYAGRTIKVIKSRAIEFNAPCGEIISLNPLTVAASGGAVELLEIKPEGSRQMTGREWSVGQRLKISDILE